MKTLIVNNAEPADLEFNQPLITEVWKITEQEPDIVQYRELATEEFRQRLPDYTAVIISGVPLDYGDETLASRTAYIQPLVEAVTVPLLGICLGHQNLGLVHGAEIVSETIREEGLKPLSLHAADPIVAGVTDGDSVYAFHTASVTVPADFIALARTPDCANHLMRHPHRPIYGMQFHPEFGGVGALLLRNFINLAQPARRPLVSHTDEALAAV